MSNEGKKAGDRLPSFKAPRDLSLLTIATSSMSLSTPGSSQQTAPPPPRPKRVFKPNIPPKRDKTKESSSDIPVAGPSTSTKDNVNKQSQVASPRGRGDRGRGGRGGGRGRREPNLIQSASVFAEGLGDPTAPKARPPRSGGGGRGGSGGSTKTPRVTSSFTREKLEDIMKSDNLVAGNSGPVDINDVLEIEDEGSGQDASEQQEPENEPVTLPLTNYLPKFRVKQPSPNKEQTEESPTPITIDEKPPLIYSESISPSDYLHATRKSRIKPVLCLIQLPSHLPVPLEQENEDKKQLTNSIESLPEGLIGKIQYLADGRCKLVLENSLDSSATANSFDIQAGKPTGFRQDLVSIDLENAKLIELGAVTHKFVITPDIEALLSGLR